MPSATKLWVPSTVASKTSSLPSDSMATTLSQKTSLVAMHLELGVVQDRRDRRQPLDRAGRASTASLPPKSTHGGRERAVRTSPVDQHRLDVVPDLDGHGVDVRVRP